jgi:hypothetical protein
MLPALDKQTDRVWRTRIIEPFVAEWRATVAAPIPSSDNPGSGQAEK